SKYNIIYYDFKDDNPLCFRKRNLSAPENIDFSCLSFIEDVENPCQKVFLKDIKDDFMKNITRYVAAIDNLRGINEKFPIALGVWGNSPMLKIKALVFEYLRSENIKIVGAQHGSAYGDSCVPWHFDSDFNRCDYFISYGFTEEDLKRVYPESKINCKIVSLGKTKLVDISRSKKDIDILFPMTVSVSVLEGGMKRIAHKLTERQVCLLEYLNSLKGVKIYVKPLPYLDSKNCSVLPVLKRLKNLKIIYNTFLMEFLDQYNPKAVLIEDPSTPLFEALSLDTEIFLMSDYIHPLEKKAFEELHLRVHYSEDTNEIIEKLDLFLNGKLERKTDSAFYNHYVCKKNTKENIGKFIDSLINEI
ncbi:MAG: hypothetical protein ABIH71_07135, partial [Candidatus Omnitrophota bacterium]